MWVADNHVESNGIRLDYLDINKTIHWYEHIPGTYGSYLVYILYCNISPQVQSHTQLLHGKISMTQISGTVERHNNARNKSLSQSESPHGNDLQCKLNGGKEFYS